MQTENVLVLLQKSESHQRFLIPLQKVAYTAPHKVNGSMFQRSWDVFQRAGLNLPTIFALRILQNANSRDPDKTSSHSTSYLDICCLLP